MRPRHKPDINHVFAKTMLWVCLCMLAIMGIAYVSHVMHAPKVDNTENINAYDTDTTTNH